MLQAKKHLLGLYRSKLREKRQGMLRLDMNEGIPGLPQDFVNNILSRITNKDISIYPEYASLEKKIGFHNNFKTENVLLSNGSDAAIKYIFDAFVSSGEKIVYTDPTFAMYPVYCSIFRARAQAVPYGPDFAFPTRDFFDAIKKGCRMAIVVNPNNPTGSVISRVELKEIASFCFKSDILLIIDEAYFYFYPETAADMAKRYKNICILRTFSKLCGMAGLRLGFCLADRKIIDSLRKVKPAFDVNSIAVMFAEALLDSPKIIPMLIKQAKEGKEYLVSELVRHNIEFRPCQGNFVLIKCPGKIEKIASKLKDKNVLVGSEFKQYFLKDYIRVTVGAIPEMKRFFRIFKEIRGN